MAVSVHFPVTFNKITLMLGLLFVVCQICNADQPNNGGGELPEEVGNLFGPAEEDILSSLTYGGNPSETKRHLGSIAAFSGSKSFVGGNKAYKRNIASIVAGKAGKKSDLAFPSRYDIYKRHLGSLMALSGQKFRPMTRSATAEMETAPMNYMINSQLPNNIFGSDLISSADIQSPNIFTDETVNPEDLLDENESGEGNFVGVKSKRFLGQLARGGWFPRHFRGIVSENSFGKRHLGSLAKLGWVPHAKSNSRLSLMGYGQQGGDVGLKRNDLTSARRRMLYHFTAPSLWGGK